MNRILRPAALLLAVGLPSAAFAAGEPPKTAFTAGDTCSAGEETPATESGLREEIAVLRARLGDLEAQLASLDGPDAAGEPTAADPGPTLAARAVAAEAPPLPPPVQDEDDDDGATGSVTTGGQDLTITGLVDTYYTRNANDPADGTNTLYYTNPNSRGFGLNQVKLEFDASGDGPIGFRSDVWFGSGARLFRDGLEPGPLADVIYLQQAYGYYQFSGGAQVDVGLFGTIAGLEVAESHLNWNYTRGLLWAWNEPFSHLGAKVSFPVRDDFTGTLMLVNGFDNAFDQNSGKTYGVQGSWAPHDGFNTTVTWIQGPENEGTNDGWLKDLSWNFYLGINERVEAMANMDYISNTDPFEMTGTSWGIGTYLRVHINDHLRIAQRYEFMRDRQGRSTGVEQTLQENTITLEAQPVADDPRLLVRFEHRRDWSDMPFFSCSSCEEGAGRLSQDTFTIGATWVFGPK